jgi:hypothetical protein
MEERYGGLRQQEDDVSDLEDEEIRGGGGWIEEDGEDGFWLTFVNIIHTRRMNAVCSWIL